jgi:cell division protein FtsB
MRNRRRKEVQSKKKRRRTFFLTLGILLVIYFSITLFFGENGLLRYWQLKNVNTDVQREIDALNRRNEEIRKQIDAAKEDSSRLEEMARKHGLTKEGELIFRFEDEQ